MEKVEEKKEKEEKEDVKEDKDKDKDKEEEGIKDDPIIVNILWILATSSYFQISHKHLLQEGIIDILTKIIKETQSISYCDYSLSTLLQLSATEECRKEMVELNCHTVLVEKVTCGVPSVVRRSLQVLANLCVDEESRKSISEIPSLLQTVTKLVDKMETFQTLKSGGDDPKEVTMDKLDMRSLLQALKFFSNLVQSDEESKLFRENGCIDWLAALAMKFQEIKLEPVVEQQIAHLAANVLIYGDNHAPWVEAGGLEPLKLMLGSDKHIAIQKESARALSNLFSFYGKLF